MEIKRAFVIFLVPLFCNCHNLGLRTSRDTRERTGTMGSRELSRGGDCRNGGDLCRERFKPWRCHNGCDDAGEVRVVYNAHSWFSSKKKTILRAVLNTKWLQYNYHLAFSTLAKNKKQYTPWLFSQLGTLTSGWSTCYFMKSAFFLQMTTTKM